MARNEIKTDLGKKKCHLSKQQVPMAQNWAKIFNARQFDYICLNKKYNIA